MILPGCTKSCFDLIGDGIVGGNLASVLALDPQLAELFSMVFQQVREDLIPADVTLNQLPRRIVCKGKVLELSCNAIRGQNDIITRMLFSLVDATHIVETERENEENKALVTVLKMRAGFAILIAQVKSDLKIIAHGITEHHQLEARMRLHSLNGNFRSFGLNALASAVADMESKSKISESDVHEIELAVQGWLSKNFAVLGVRWDNPGQDVLHEVPDSTLFEFSQVFEGHRAVGNPEISAVVRDFTNFIRGKSLESVLAPIVSMTENLSTRFSKPARIQIDGGSIRVNSKKAQRLVDVMAHIIRNTMDHGIESHHERTASNKSPIGNIEVKIRESGANQLTVDVTDDGRGINPDQVAEVAIQRGLTSREVVKNLTDPEKIALIFHPGFTLRNEISDISGRGIGMSAVRDLVVNEFNGSIAVESRVGSGTIIRMTVCLEHYPKPSLGENDGKAA